MPMVARVAVEQTAFHFDKFYDYLVPEPCRQVQCGCRVMVPFGGGNRSRQGIVMELAETAEVSRVKPLLSVLDPQPLLDDEMLRLAQWLRERTFCTVFDAVRAMLPTGLYMRIKPWYRAETSPPASALEGLSAVEKALWETVKRSPEGIAGDRLLHRHGLEDDSPLLQRLVDAGLLVRFDGASRLVGDATMRMVRLLSGVQEDLAERMKALKCTEKQKAVLRLLQDVGAASLKELCYFCSVTAAVVAALEKKELVEQYDQEMLRAPHEGVTEQPEIRSVPLNTEQQRVYDGLAALYGSHKPAGALLYGVTGSGKTQVYMNLIDRVLQDGRQVLVLVPEISLTPQMMTLFLQRYGRRVAVLHSALAIGERTDEWKRIKRGEARIVIGTRSAVFAPCRELGLVVMDEEQEHTYKSESAPRYHARDVARFRCAQHGALLLLTSATPSIESYHAAQSGRYALFELHSRYGLAQLPEVEVADMRQETLEGGCIGEKLRGEMQTCIESGRQAILLLNRRGYNTFVSCRSCGHVITCPSCSISMTYHRANGRLICHYCGYMQDPVSACPECGSDKVRYAGLGTQKVEQELDELFPSARVLRMDTDTTMSRFAYEEKFKAFAEGQYDIMIGTQMVAKGLDFPRVGLVGILSADQSLYGDDYRCFETTFSLLTQVIGRAGRRDTRGKAVIQTYTPENYVIELASRQDYPAFYATEIAARRMMKYPPYADLCQFGFVGLKEEEVRAAVGRFLHQLRETVTRQAGRLPVIVLDPVPASVYRVSGKYRYKLLMKTVNTAALREMIAQLLTDFSRKSENKNVTVFADINPASML